MLTTDLRNVLVKGGDLASSLDAVDIFFDDCVFLFLVWLVLMDNHKEKEAISELSRAIAFKADLNLLHLRAAFHEHIGDVMGALRDYRVAVSVDPNHEMLELHSSREP
ncbi:ETO1-like protein 1 [Camellia lanceoleosa]|uniref:ETO1-like protein 1 n=1 Tax=Camellia lanceoleosa TaxID=1840588 RepID=A0ACC0F6V7_9ERIC|nr:ETO1-like protein 1 [Camellia lanceoleosa]